MTLPENYTLHPTAPSVNSYLHLRSASGLTPVTPAQGHAAITGSWYACHITYTDPTTQTSSAIAQGRIISDGGWYFHIADMAVLPEHQRRGLGGVVLRHLLGYIRENAPEGKPYVNLFADGPGRRLYARYGFLDAMPHSLGMVWRGENLG